MNDKRREQADESVRRPESISSTDVRRHAAEHDVIDMTNETASAVERHNKTRQLYAARRKWGYVLMVLGVITALDAGSPVPIPLIGSPALILGVILLLVGGAMTVEPRRMRDTNEAMLIGMKNNNRLTVPLLALEMDISLTKAEKIINRLMKNGVAEIDLSADDPDGGITYKLKGV